MAEFCRVENGEPVGSIQEFDSCPEGWFPVEELVGSPDLETEFVETYYINGSVKRRIVAHPTLAVEQSMRAARNSLLAASDWTQVPDSPLSISEKEAWAVYRQELRDMPFVSDAVWPQPPS